MLALTLILGTSIVLPVALPFACGSYLRHVRHRNGAVSAERSACVKSPRLARFPVPRSCSPASRGRADRAAAHAGGMNGGVCRWGGIGKPRLTLRVWRR